VTQLTAILCYMLTPELTLWFILMQLHTMRHAPCAVLPRAQKLRSRPPTVVAPSSEVVLLVGPSSEVVLLVAPLQKSSEAISTDCECAMAAAASSLTTCTHTAFELTSL